MVKNRWKSSKIVKITENRWPWNSWNLLSTLKIWRCGETVRIENFAVSGNSRNFAIFMVFPDFSWFSGLCEKFTRGNMDNLLTLETVSPKSWFLVKIDDFWQYPATYTCLKNRCPGPEKSWFLLIRNLSKSWKLTKIVLSTSPRQNLKMTIFRKISQNFPIFQFFKISWNFH